MSITQLKHIQVAYNAIKIYSSWNLLYDLVMSVFSIVWLIHGTNYSNTISTSTAFTALHLHTLTSIQQYYLLFGKNWIPKWPFRNSAFHTMYSIAIYINLRSTKYSLCVCFADNKYPGLDSLSILYLQVLEHHTNT